MVDWQHADHLLSIPWSWAQPSPHRALAVGEIAGILEDYRRAAERAMDAGFEGVELHAANGYLVDQFLQDGSNHRSDEYGGPIKNRTRFLLEVVGVLVSVWGGSGRHHHSGGGVCFRSCGTTAARQTGDGGSMNDVLHMGEITIQ